MKKIKILAAAALIVAMCSNSSVVFAQGTVFNIDAAINSALKNSYDVKSQNYSVQLAQNAYDQALDAAEKAEERLIMNEDMIELKSKPDKTEEEKKALERFTPLSDEQRYQLIKTKEMKPLEAKYQLEIANNNKEVAENTLRFNIYTQYASLMNLKDTMNVEQNKLDSMLNTYNKTQLQLKLGMISKADAKKNEVNYMNEKPILVKEQRQMEVAQMSINKVLGDDLSKRYDDFSKDIIAENPKVKTLDQYLADAFKNRVEITNLQEYVNVKKAEYEIASREYPNEDEKNNQSAKYDIEKAQNDLDMQKLSIQEDITNDYNNLITKAKKIEYSKKSFDISKKNYLEATKKYELGMISKLDLDSKAITFKLAESNLKSLERDLWIAQLMMDYKCNKGINASAVLGATSNN